MSSETNDGGAVENNVKVSLVKVHYVKKKNRHHLHSVDSSKWTKCSIGYRLQVILMKIPFFEKKKKTKDKRQ